MAQSFVCILIDKLEAKSQHYPEILKVSQKQGCYFCRQKQWLPPGREKLAETGRNWFKPAETGINRKPQVDGFNW